MTAFFALLLEIIIKQTKLEKKQDDAVLDLTSVKPAASIEFKDYSSLFIWYFFVVLYIAGRRKETEIKNFKYQYN